MGATRSRVYIVDAKVYEKEREIKKKTGRRYNDLL